ncbi:MAG: hypothetical protein K8R88_10100 [Armatimonadetes bacterium]|nr:hypothetical protein [Armatimonadota bacterium]
MQTKSIFATALALAGICVQAQVTKVGEAYQIRRSFRVGDSASYLFSQNPTNSDVMATPSSLPVLAKTVSLIGSQAKVQYIFTPNTKFARTYELNVDRFNQCVGSFPFLAFGDIRYPSVAIKVGQSWFQTIAHPHLPKPISMKLTFKGFRILGKLRVADIACLVNSETTESLFKGSGVYSIRVSDGSLNAINWSESIAIPDKTNVYRTRRMTNSVVLTRS